MQEAYWATSQKRISLRRHASLMDYYIHEGNQSSTVLALNFPGTASVHRARHAESLDRVRSPRRRPRSGLPRPPTVRQRHLQQHPAVHLERRHSVAGRRRHPADLAFSSFADATNAVSSHQQRQDPTSADPGVAEPGHRRMPRTATRKSARSSLLPARSCSPILSPVIRWCASPGGLRTALQRQLLLRRQRKRRARAQRVALPRQSRQYGAGRFR